MPRVLCTLPNASEEIGGTRFAPVEGGMCSEELTDEDAERFLRIPGYRLFAPAASRTVEKRGKPKSSSKEDTTGSTDTRETE